jgi:hypothetical protein
MLCSALLCSALLAGLVLACRPSPRAPRCACSSLKSTQNSTESGSWCLTPPTPLPSSSYHATSHAAAALVSGPSRRKWLPARLKWALGAALGAFDEAAVALLSDAPDVLERFLDPAGFGGGALPHPGSELAALLTVAARRLRGQRGQETLALRLADLAGADALVRDSLLLLLQLLLLLSLSSSFRSISSSFERFETLISPSTVVSRSSSYSSSFLSPGCRPSVGRAPSRLGAGGQRAHCAEQRLAQARLCTALPPGRADWGGMVSSHLVALVSGLTLLVLLVLEQFFLLLSVIFFLVISTASFHPQSYLRPY